MSLQQVNVGALEDVVIFNMDTNYLETPFQDLDSLPPHVVGTETSLLQLSSKVEMLTYLKGKPLTLIIPLISPLDYSGLKNKVFRNLLYLCYDCCIHLLFFLLFLLSSLGS